MWLRDFLASILAIVRFPHFSISMHLLNMGHTKEEQCSYLSVCISSCKHNRTKIESSNQAFVLDQVCKWRSVGGAWYSQMCSQTGCLLLPLAWECFYTRAHDDIILHKITSSCSLAFSLSHVTMQPQAGSHTRVATCVVKLIVGTWLPTGLLWVGLEQVPILIHARPSFKGEMHELDKGKWNTVFILYRTA